MTSQAVSRCLRSRSCIIDGKAVACDDNGVALFNRVRYRRHDESIFLYAFDLIELNGDDFRRDPLERRKARLEVILAKVGAWHPVQRAYGGRRRDGVSPRLQAGPRRRCLEVHS
jgi:bifunctional non-homologous end joining protein LigD